MPNAKGDIYHGVKQSDVGYSGFGEAYFTTIHKGEIKGWKKHSLMQMNLVVPVGAVRFYIFDEKVNKTVYFDLGEANYQRLTVPPGYWVAFAGLGDGKNLILNLSDILHNPSESVTVDLQTFPLE